MNTSEHFALILPPLANEELIIAAATPYLAAGGNNHLLEIFEAAHSVVLAVFSAPQNADMTAKHLPFYVDNLFAVGPFPTLYVSISILTNPDRYIHKTYQSANLD